jgi:hypothetical protein
MSGTGLVVPGKTNCPLAPARAATRPKPKFQIPDFTTTEPKKIGFRARAMVTYLLPMNDRARPKPPRGSRANEVNEEGDAEGGPSSEVRPVEAVTTRSLYVATRLRGAEAQSAIVTVTDVSGRVLFEGGLGADGTVHIVLDGLGERTVVRVLLETVRVHRQAEVVVARPVTEHAFT